MTYDLKEVVGIGFGPSNLATAVAFKEAGFNDYLFLERKSHFAWFPGMMLKKSGLQNSFIKDLVSLSNPRSYFTFLNYLFEKGLIDDFINLRTFFPSRDQFNDYMAWAADQFENHVCYSSNILKIVPNFSSKGTIDSLEIIYQRKNSEKAQHLVCKNLVVGVGSDPFIPVDILPHKRATHTVDVINFLEKINPNEKADFLVIGGSQSSAEILYHLLETFPKATIQVIARGFIYRSLEASALVNQLFSESGMDWFFAFPEKFQKKIYKDLFQANYSAVDDSLISKIASILYEDKRKKQERVKFHHYHELISAFDDGINFNCKLKKNRIKSYKTVVGSHIIFATGFSYDNVFRLLNPLKKWITHDEEGIPLRNADYSIKGSSALNVKIFAHSVGDAAFGLTEGGMTNLATRAKRILESIQMPQDSINPLKLIKSSKLICKKESIF